MNKADLELTNFWDECDKTLSDLSSPALLLLLNQVVAELDRRDVSEKGDS